MAEWPGSGFVWAALTISPCITSSIMSMVIHTIRPHAVIRLICAPLLVRALNMIPETRCSPFSIVCLSCKDNQAYQIVYAIAVQMPQH